MDLSNFTFNKKILSKVIANFKAKLCLYMFYNNFDYIKRLGQNLVTNLLNKIKNFTYFDNLTVEFYILYSLNTHDKFCVNKILFII